MHYLRCTAALEEIRLLNRFNPAAPDLPLLVIFGMPRLLNWYPNESDRNNMDLNESLQIEEKVRALWNAGYRCAVVPSDLIDNGMLKLDTQGRPVIHGHTFHAIIYLYPEYAKPSTLSFLDAYVEHGELDRREFLSNLTTAVGFLALGLNPTVSAAALRLSGGRESGRLPFVLELAQGRGLYRIHTLSERAILETYTHLLEDACRFVDTDWKSSSLDTALGYWGDGVSAGNGGIRTVASMVLACATLLKYDEGLGAGDRKNLLDKSTAALRYATTTHITGTQKCTDGKPWGATEKFGSESWQAGMWTGTLATGTWLIWDKLDPALQQAFQRVAAWESDILSHRLPPNGLWFDTKAEENGWEVPCLVLTELMFPSHPHAAAWHEAALRYMLNTLCTEADTHDTTSVDRRPLNEWVKGANLQPDFTLENHNIFHPSYVACSCYFLTQAVMYYTYAGKPIPQTATHNLMDTWKMFQTIILPWGEAAYPQGMDWELHGLPYINLFAALATRNKDPFASHMEQSSLQYLCAWQKMGQGSLAIPGSRFGTTRHAINAEQAAYGLLAHKIFGPAASESSYGSAAAQQQGAREYPYVNFIAHRTMKKFASCSWKNRFMGMVVPIDEGREDNPAFTVPIQNGFVGSFELLPVGDVKVTVVDHSWNETPDGFETTGTLLLNGGRLKQTLRMISVGSQTVVFEDRVTALSDVTVQREQGGPIGIENDEITGGTRTVSCQSGQVVFDWRNPQHQANLSGSWVNVDGRIGAVILKGSGIAYAQASDYSRGLSVYTDILYGSRSDQTRQFKAGKEVARRVAVCFVEVTPNETLALSQSCKHHTSHGGEVLHIKQPDGRNAEVQLRF